MPIWRAALGRLLSFSASDWLRMRDSISCFSFSSFKALGGGGEADTPPGYQRSMLSPLSWAL